MNHPLPNAITRSCQRMAGIALLLLLGLAQPAWAALDYSVGSVTVLDTTTLLVWDRCPYGQTLVTNNCTGIALTGNWAQALDAAVAANAANYRGFTDWRVPNKNELESIVNIGNVNPAIDTTAFPNMPANSAFWTSTTRALIPSTAWFVGVNTGGALPGNKTNPNYVRLVRSGQSFASFDAFPPVAAQTIAFGAAPVVIVGGTGTVTTTGGGSGIARVYASTTLAACTVNSSTGVVTGVAAGTNNCTITADQAGNANYSVAPQVSQSFSIGAAPVVTPPEPVPTIAQLPVTIGGLSTLPAILNMADGEGPSFMAALVGILSNAVGQPLQFVEQNARGTVSLRGFNGGNLAFIPYGFQTGDNRANGVYAVGNGQYHAVVNGRQVTLAPALVNPHQLTALMPGVDASQAGNGVITATVNGVTYVVQAGVGVQLDPASANAQLVTGADGLLHFIDAQGNNQVLYPAFSEPIALRNILRGLDLSSTLNIQLDGTAAIVLNGQRYTLVPDMTLLPVPADRAGQDWWQESATRYRVANAETFPWRVRSQGFTVKP